MALKVDVTLSSPAGDALSDAISTTLTTSYSVSLGNNVKKMKMTGAVQTIVEGSDVGAKLLVLKNLGTAAGTDYIQIFNTSSDGVGTNRVATLDAGEVAVIPISGNPDISAHAETANTFLEVMEFTIAAADRT